MAFLVFPEHKIKRRGGTSADVDPSGYAIEGRSIRPIECLTRLTFRNNYIDTVATTVEHIMDNTIQIIQVSTIF